MKLLCPYYSTAGNTNGQSTLHCLTEQIHHGLQRRAALCPHCLQTHSKITFQGTSGFLIYREFPDLGEEKDNDPIFNVIFLGPKVTLYLLYFSSVS